MGCVGRCFGILASNIFFLALLAMSVAVFTNRWAESSQKGVDVNAVPTDAYIRLGVFDMSTRIMQGGKLVYGEGSYGWCAKEGLNTNNELWTDLNTYCNLLISTQICVVICLAVGLCAGVISAFMSANVIKDNKFKDVACAASFFMFVQFISSIVAFACFFFIGARVNNDLDRSYPGLRVVPSYSVFLAVICAGLVLLGLITTSALGSCGKSSAAEKPASQSDLEAGGRPSSAKVVTAEPALGETKQQGAQ